MAVRGRQALTRIRRRFVFLIAAAWILTGQPTQSQIRLDWGEGSQFSSDIQSAQIGPGGHSICFQVKLPPANSAELV
jgi:hypothetical protein